MSKTSPNIVTNPETPLQQAIRGEEQDAAFRQMKLDADAVDADSFQPDTLLPAHQQNKPADPRANFDQKIYLFPPSYNALRQELEENWPTFFYGVPDGFAISPAWAMVYDAPQFVGFCNGALDMTVQFDSANVEGICKKFLNGFRKLRGLSAIA